MNDVAARAGVSVGTVSHVLNHPERVREATRERVQAAIDALGFTRNANARSLVAGTSHTIGMVVVNLGNTFFVDAARGAQQEATAAGMSLLLADADDDVERQDAHLGFFDGVRAAGVLLAPLTDPAAGVARVRRHGMPVVLANYATGRDDACAVLVDNERVGSLAAEHVLALGHRRLALVGGEDSRQPVRDRRAGVRRAVAAAGAGAELVELPAPDLEASGGRTAGARIARMPADRRPQAVIAVTDLLGAGVVQELVAAGLSVPGDVAVMGCDHDSRAWGGAVPLTSVRLHGEEVGSAAVRLLMEEVTGATGHAHRTVVVEPSLVVRESTAGRHVAGRAPAPGPRAAPGPQAPSAARAEAADSR